MDAAREAKRAQKKGSNFKSFFEKCFEVSRSTEGVTLMAAMSCIKNHCIFIVPRATARIAAFLRGGRAQGAIIHGKYAIDLFCGRARGRRSEDGTFSLSWRVLWCPQGPQEKVLKIRGGHQDAHQLD